MPCVSGSFDVVLDKGTLDAFEVDKRNGWDDLHSALTEIHRVLRNGGLYVQVSFAQPFQRQYLYEEPFVGAWKDISIHRFGETFHYFIYELVKQSAGS